MPVNLEPITQTPPISPTQPEPDVIAPQSPLPPTEPNPLPLNDLESSSPASIIKPESKLIRTLKNVSPFTYFFVAVLTISLISLAYFFAQNQALKSQMDQVTQKRQAFESQICVYNDQVYHWGEQFIAEDGCNSCSCTEAGEVTCTAMACDITNPPSPDDEPITLTPDQSGQFNLSSTKLGFSASFSAQDIFVTNCQGSGEGYEFWIYSSNTDTRAGVCSYEGPAGITLSDVEDVSQIECWPEDDETYSLQQSEKNINNNSLIYCQSTPKNTSSNSQESSLITPVTSAYIKNPHNDSAIWVWMQDPKLQSVFDQILSTFEFTNTSSSKIEEEVRQAVIATLAKPYMLNPNENPLPGVELLSVEVNENNVSLDFSKEIASGGRAVFEDTIRLVDNAIHPIIQGEGVNPKYPEMRSIITIEGKPIDAYFQ